MSVRRTLLPIALVLLGLACREETTQRAFVARVDGETLTQEALHDLLSEAVPGQDTSALRSALVEQWVAEALLYQAAVDAGLPSEPDVAQQIEENRRALLVSAFVDRYLTEHPPRFTDQDIQQYYDQNSGRLNLREPYVAYRLFGAPTEADARQARASLVAREVTPDTLWQHFRGRPGFVTEVDSAGPERGLYAHVAEVRDVLLTLRPGQTSSVIPTDSLFYVVQVTARAQPGDQAPLAWLRPEIVHRLTLERRKQAARRLVQQLRAEAIARGALVVPTDSLQ